MAVIGVALLGLELGRWFNDNFRWAREAGQAFAFGILALWEKIKGGAKIVGAVIKWVWENAEAAIGIAAAGILQVWARVVGAAAQLGIVSEETATAVDAAASAATNAAKADLGDLKDLIQAQKDLTTAKLETIETARGEATLALDKEFKSKDLDATKGKSLRDQIVKDMALVSGPIDQVIAKLKELSIAYFAIPGGDPDGAGGDGGAALPPPIVDLTENMEDAKDATEELTDAQKELNSVMEQAGSELSGALVDVAMSAKTGKEAVNDLVQSVIRLILQTLILKAVKATIGGLGGGGGPDVANSRGGLAVSTQARRHFAAGGIISSPTLFPMGGNKTGVAGEKGAEMILPLNRVFEQRSEQQQQVRPIKGINLVDPVDVVRKGLERDPSVVLNVVGENLDEGRDLDQLVARAAARNRNR